MTCITGCKTDGGVLLGGDALGSSGYSGNVNSESKVFRLSREVACGYTSSFRMGQVLRFHVTPPQISVDELQWAVAEFIPVIREAFRAAGYSEIHNNEETGGTFLLAVRARLFTVQSDFSVLENRTAYSACGSGQSFAMGAMHALWTPKVKPRQLLRAGLLAAEEFATGVRGPFSFTSTSA